MTDQYFLFKKIEKLQEEGKKTIQQAQEEIEKTKFERKLVNKARTQVIAPSYIQERDRKENEQFYKQQMKELGQEYEENLDIKSEESVEDQENSDKQVSILQKDQKKTKSKNVKNCMASSAENKKKGSNLKQKSPKSSPKKPGKQEQYDEQQPDYVQENIIQVSQLGNHTFNKNQTNMSKKNVQKIKNNLKVSPKTKEENTMSKSDQTQKLKNE